MAEISEVNFIPLYMSPYLLFFVLSRDDEGKSAMSFFENRNLTQWTNESCLHLSISREEHDWFITGSLDLLIFKMKKL